MIDFDQATKDLHAMLDGKRKWTDELRDRVADFLWRYASDRCLRYLAEAMGHPEAKKPGLSSSVKQMYPLVGLVPIPDFLRAWEKAAAYEKSDVEYLAQRDEEERQRWEGTGNRPSK